MKAKLDPDVVDFLWISDYETYVKQLINRNESYQTKVIKGNRKSPRRIRVIRLSQKEAPDHGTD
jgi:hypothetical protein